MRARTRIVCATVALLAVSGSLVFAHFRQSAPKPDPEAYALLKKADEARQTLPADFAGVSGDITVNDNGKISTGKFAYTPKRGADLNLSSAGKEAEAWANDAVASSFSHRLKGDFEKENGSKAITLAPDDGSPIGRKVLFHDRMQSTDRVRDNQILEVDRTMGKMRFIITVMQNQKTDDGKFLPSQFVVTYFDADSGAVDRVECFTDGFSQIGGAWLPTTRRVVTLKGGMSSARSLKLTNMRLDAVR